MKPATVEWDARALERHYQWAFKIAVEIDVAAAEAYLKRIDAVIARIEQIPEGHPETQTRPGRRKAVEVQRGYQVVYDYDGAARKAVIVAVLKGPPVPI